MVDTYLLRGVQDGILHWTVHAPTRASMSHHVTKTFPSTAASNSASPAPAYVSALPACVGCHRVSRKQTHASAVP